MTSTTLNIERKRLAALRLVGVGVLLFGLLACQKQSSPEERRPYTPPIRMSRDAGTAQPGSDPAMRETYDRGSTAEPDVGIGGVPSDPALAAKVTATLISESGLGAVRINVQSDNGVVTLSGTVGTVGVREEAAEITSRVDGVRGVRNLVVVAAGPYWHEIEPHGG